MGTAANPYPYLFKETFDGVCYLIAFFALPVYSVVNGIRTASCELILTALSCCFCTFYDSYSRYDKSSGRVRIIKIYVVGGIHLALSVFLTADFFVLLDEGHMICPYVYGLLATAPAVGVADLFNMAKDDVLSRG